MESIDIKKYTINKKAKQLLLPACRQHMHNDGSGLIPAYDYEETIKIVENLLERSDNSDYAVQPKASPKSLGSINSLTEGEIARVQDWRCGKCKWYYEPKDFA